MIQMIRLRKMPSLKLFVLIFFKLLFKIKNSLNVYLLFFKINSFQDDTKTGKTFLITIPGWLNELLRVIFKTNFKKSTISFHNLLSKNLKIAVWQKKKEFLFHVFLQIWSRKEAEEQIKLKQEISNLNERIVSFLYEKLDREQVTLNICLFSSMLTFNSTLPNKRIKFLPINFMNILSRSEWT
jgi:hypothetical protein